MERNESFENLSNDVRGARRARRRRLFAVLPTLLTLGNGACGFGSLTFAAKVGLAQRTGWGQTDSDYLFIAGMLVFLAMVFDMLDGRAARWARESSQFGAELDSLCDAISFGVAPAFILVKFSSDLHPRLLWVIAVLYVMGAVLRLARFNVETEEDDTHDWFSGLPSPAAAGTIAAFMIAYPELEFQALQVTPQSSLGRSVQQFAYGCLYSLQILLPLITLALAGLMVSRVRYPHLFNQLFRGKRSRKHLVQLLAGISTVFILRELALPLVFCWFALGPPVQRGMRLLWRGRLPGPAVSGAEPLPTADATLPPDSPPPQV